MFTVTIPPPAMYSFPELFIDLCQSCADELLAQPDKPPYTLACTLDNRRTSSVTQCGQCGISAKDTVLDVYGTNAPMAYDGFGTQELGTTLHPILSIPLRVVGIHAEHSQWQRSRYYSGMYCCIDIEPDTVTWTKEVIIA